MKFPLIKMLRGEMRKASRILPILAVDLFTRHGGGFAQLFSGDSRTYESLAKVYQENVWVYASIFAIASSGGMIPWGVYRRDEKGQWQEEYDHPLALLLRNMNPAETYYDVMEATLSYLEIAGKEFWELAYAEVSNKSGGPQEVYTIRPDYITPVPDTKGQSVAGYKFNLPGKQEPKPFAPDEIMSFYYFSPLKHWEGQGGIQAIVQTIILEEQALKWNQRFFQNDATPRGVLTSDYDATPEEAKDIESKWGASLRGKGQHKTPFLPKGLKYTPIGTNPKDMEFGGMRKWNRSEIMAALGTNNAVLGITENMTYDNYRMQKHSFYSQTMRPKMSKMASAVNSRLLPLFQGDDKNVELRYDFSDILSEDTGAKVTWIYKLFRCGSITPNQIRVFLKLGPTTPEGDSYYTPNDVTPTSAVTAEAAALHKELSTLRGDLRDMIGVDRLEEIEEQVRMEEAKNV